MGASPANNTNSGIIIMQIIKQSDLDFESVVVALKDGKTIVYPTETCYGLGCDARNGAAVEKIVKIKQRREEKPFLVVVPDVAMAMEYLEWSPKLQELADKYWPGALTVVGRALSLRGPRHGGGRSNPVVKQHWIAALPRVARNDSLADGVVAPDGTVALRVTAHPVAAALARALGRPLISTSANISGKEPSYSAEEVIKMFVPMKYGIPHFVEKNQQPDQPDILLDFGVLPQNPPTTIVRVVGDEMRVLRKGSVLVS